MIDISYPNIVAGLCIIVVICLALIYKYVWQQNSEEPVLAGHNRFAPKGGGVRKADENIDFFNMKQGTVGKSVRLSVRDENKIYYLVELNNNKVLVMEEEIYIPEERDSEMSGSATDSPDIHVPDEYMAEQSDLQKEALISDIDDVGGMKEIINDANTAHMSDQKLLFDIMKDQVDPDDED